jgi:hypothetical protein
MKVQGAITQTQTIKGTISKEELVAFVRETVHVPFNATVRFCVVASSDSVHPIVDIDSSHPLTFLIEWSLPVGKDEQG